MGTAPEPSKKGTVDVSAMSWCMRELDSLSTELNKTLDATLASWPARRSSVEWEDWSPNWRGRLLNVGARCRLSKGDVSGTAELQLAYQRLSELHRHYTTLAVQFSKEIGPHADALNEAMRRARNSIPSDK